MIFRFSKIKKSVPPLSFGAGQVTSEVTVNFITVKHKGACDKANTLANDPPPFSHHH